MSQPDLEFDSLAYWRARHEQYLLDPRGVGNVGLTASENERIYKALDIYIENIVINLHKAPPVRVLDLGCGIGMLAAAFIRTGCEYTGVDVSPKAVEIAKSNYPKGRFEVANIAQLPLTGEFDIIIERTVLIHLVEEAYWHAVIAEVKRLLARDGVFIINDHLPVTDSEVSTRAAHVKFRLYGQYAEALQKLNMKFDLELRTELSARMALSPNTHLVTHA